MSELKHYGRLGMKWYKHIFGDTDPRARYNKGSYYTERERQDYEDTVIPKGEHVYRVTSNPNEKNEGRTYITDIPKDALNYIQWIGGSNLRFGKDTYAVRMKVTSDIIIPSIEKASEVIVNKFKDVKISDLMKKFHIKETDDPFWVEVWSNRNLDEFRFAAYNDYFHWVFEEGDHPDRRKEFFSALKEAGYNAVIDEADRGSSERPIIVFERESNLETESVTKITEKIVKQAGKIR